MGRDISGRILRDVLLAFVRVHVLHHASEGRIYGVEMMEELRRHGYAIGPGTLYPLLHALEEDGALTSATEVVAGKQRRYYRTTRAGDRLLAALRDKISELVDEVAEPRKQDRRRQRPAAGRSR
ncbi:MAG: PadR family transcriptional regulator [Burkholderiales bacterium]